MIGFISDVHGNLPALEAVLGDVAGVGCERLWCLGDTVGYGADPAACIDLVRERCEVVLAGNHDVAVAGGDVNDAPGMATGGPGAGIAHAAATIGEERIAWLRGLSPSFTGDDHLEAHHGSIHDPVWEYVKDDQVATRHLAAQQRPLCAVGHTHAQLLFELADGAQSAVGGLVRGGSRLVLHPGSRRVFNPGSVGQPRDGDPRAAWALLDRGELTFRRVEYDVAAAQEAIRAAGLPEGSAARLATGQ